MIEAQDLYDVRALAGDISGADLHELFNRTTGHPSPSGKTLIKRSDLLKDPDGQILLDRLESPLANSLADIKDYLDVP